ncbi:MAG TPA: hypothetical protein VKU19_21825 [Bryobacteraceae bacterium]|nr:hypothetical protein [Bryobacteraceae bacterium]
MKINHSIVVCLTLIIAVVAFAPAAYAQGAQNACTNSSTAGSYTLTCSGFTAAGAGGSLLPMMQVGVASGDASGNWTGTATINIGGQVVIPDAKVTGKTTINPDCTGAITYNKGTPSEMNITFVVNPKSEEIFGLITDKGTVAACVLKLIGKVPNSEGSGR